MIGTTLQPLSVVYRVVVARAGRYGLGDDSPLRDQAGRLIRVFEGLVLRIPSDHVASLGLTVSDLDRVTDVSVPAFCRLWTAQEAIDAEPTAAIFAGGADRAGVSASGSPSHTWCPAAALGLPSARRQYLARIAPA